MNGSSGNLRSIWAKIGDSQESNQKRQEIGDERDAPACMRSRRHQAFALAPANKSVFIRAEPRARHDPKFDSLDCKFRIDRLFD